MAHLIVIPASEVDLPSLATLVPRAFHKSNAYFRQTLPDTPLLRQWWANLLRDAINDPVYHVLTIIDEKAAQGTRLAIGLLLLRRIDAEGNGENVFIRHPATADHDQPKYAAMLNGSKEGGPYEKNMRGRDHFSLDLFGVDDVYQGTGLGKRLLEHACAIADAEGVDVFVQANVFAKSFYKKRGFVCVEEVILPGPEKYGEVFMIHRAERSLDA